MPNWRQIKCLVHVNRNVSANLRVSLQLSFIIIIIVDFTFDLGTRGYVTLAKKRWHCFVMCSRKRYTVFISATETWLQYLHEPFDVYF